MFHRTPSKYDNMTKTSLLSQESIPQERSERMSEKEKRIIEKLKDAIPNMSEFDKGYILGKTESFSENNLEQESDKKEAVTSQ